MQSTEYERGDIIYWRSKFRGEPYIGVVTRTPGGNGDVEIIWWYQGRSDGLRTGSLPPECQVIGYVEDLTDDNTSIRVATVRQ